MLWGMSRLTRWLFEASEPVASDAEVFHQTLQSLVVSQALRNNDYATNKALSVAGIFRARQMNADILASLPLKAGDTLIPAPSRDQDLQEFVTEIVLAMQDYGEAYVKVTKGEPRVLHNGRMHVSWNKAQDRRFYDYDNVRMRTSGVARNLFVLPLNRGAADLTGTGPMQSKRIAGLVAEQEYSQQFFENNAQHTGALVHPGVLTAGESKALYEAWVAGQAERSTGVLSGGMDYKPMSFNPSDSEWVDTHLVGIGDISSLFGVPSVLLNYSPAGSSLTYQSMDKVFEGYWRATLAPMYARRIEAMLTEITGSVVKFEPEELFLASLRERTSATATLINAGFEADAARDVSGLPAMPHTGVIPSTVSQSEGDPT